MRGFFCLSSPPLAMELPTQNILWSQRNSGLLREPKRGRKSPNSEPLFGYCDFIPSILVSVDWNHDEDLCNTPLSTASLSIIYLPLPRLLHPWEFWGFALGFVRVKPGSSTPLPPRFGWGRQGGTAALLIYITTHFTGRKMLFLSLGATRKESKELEAERSKFLLLRLFCPLFRPTAFLKHKRETEEIRAVSSKSLPVKINCEESTQDKRVRN